MNFSALARVRSTNKQFSTLWLNYTIIETTFQIYKFPITIVELLRTYCWFKAILYHLTFSNSEMSLCFDRIKLIAIWLTCWAVSRNWLNTSLLAIATSWLTVTKQQMLLELRRKKKHLNKIYHFKYFLLTLWTESQKYLITERLKRYLILLKSSLKYCKMHSTSVARYCFK